MSTCPYDPEGGSLCAACITPLYEEISISILSGITLVCFSILGFTTYNLRTKHMTRTLVKLYILPFERILFNGFMFTLWANEFFLIHFWRISSITVACPPSSVYIGVKVVNEFICCGLLSVAMMTQSHYVYRFYTWIPNVLQCSTIFVYYIDAASREDICWVSFAVIPSVMLGIMNVISMPYILTGGQRAILPEEIRLNESALRKMEEARKQYRFEEQSALVRPSLEIGRELESMAVRRTRNDSDSDGIDGGIVQLGVTHLDSSDE